HRSAIVRTVAGGCGPRLDPDCASRVRPHAMGAQSELLWRPDALPPDLRGQQGGDPQPQPPLSRPGLRRSEVRGETLREMPAAVPKDRSPHSLLLLNIDEEQFPAPPVSNAHFHLAIHHRTNEVVDAFTSALYVFVHAVDDDFQPIVVEVQSS